MTINFKWTDEIKTTVAEMWRNGESMLDIANAIGGVSRNAVAGLIYRNRDKFSKRVDARGTSTHVVIDKVERQEIKAHAEEVASGRLYRYAGKALKGSTPVAFKDLAPRRCKWPLNDLNDPSTSDMPCCGLPTVGPRYCAHHRLRSGGPGTASERTAHKIGRAW